jgi:hypothetical protein
VDKSILLKSRLPEADVDIPGVGTIRVRGLSRAEVLLTRKATDDEHVDGPRVLTLERKMLAAAMIDPKLTEDEVGQWQRASGAGELHPVILKIQELSGLLEDSEKAAHKSDADRPGPEVRVLPGAEAGDDGGEAASGDE